MYIGKTFEETGCRQMAATQCGNDTLSWRPTAQTVFKCCRRISDKLIFLIL